MNICISFFFLCLLFIGIPVLFSGYAHGGYSIVYTLNKGTLRTHLLKMKSNAESFEYDCRQYKIWDVHYPTNPMENIPVPECYSIEVSYFAGTDIGGALASSLTNIDFLFPQKISFDVESIFSRFVQPDTLCVKS